MLTQTTFKTDSLENFCETTPVNAWRLPPFDLVLPDDAVHVWRANLELNPTSLHHLRDLLSSDELSRAASYHFSKDRDHYIAARGQLRVILGRYLGLEPAQLRFSYSGYGKPALTNALGQDILNFNMSHSDQLALYAVARHRKIGVDLERVHADFGCEEIAERFFAPAEQSILRSLPVEVRPQAFFNGWTRKEAYLKARGQGLALPLYRFVVSLIPGEPAQLLDADDDIYETSRWSLVALNPGPDYAAALAVEGHDWQLTCWQWAG